MTITVLHSEVYNGTFTVESKEPLKDHEIGGILGAFDPTKSEPYTVGEFKVTFAADTSVGLEVESPTEEAVTPRTRR